jgi:hypothetical protein
LAIGPSVALTPVLAGTPAEHAKRAFDDPLSNPEKGRLPSKQEKVTAAESAAVGPNDPPEGSFDSVSAADTSELNRPAMRAAYREHSGYISLSA